MHPSVQAQIHEWYRLPDGDMFRVTDTDDEHVRVQYTDGTFEDVELEIWDKLGVVHTEPSEEWLEEHENSMQELEYYNLGVAPGTEGMILEADAI